MPSGKQVHLELGSTARESGPVECLGITFENDEKRREHFLGLLREKLKDPEFRKIEGFPIGTDEDILALSDPPYYTPCPNPFIGDFIKLYGKPYDSSLKYSIDPYTGDLSATRNNPFVNAHSYATKVPHEIVAKLLLHYTSPGDIVLDAFAGTGMTGVAGQLCGDIGTMGNLGITHEVQNEHGEQVSNIGNRNVILSDISPAATFLAANFNLPINEREFEDSVKEISDLIESELGWMYETKHEPDKIGRITCTLWSDVFICTECGCDIVFWDSAVDLNAGVITDEIRCKGCDAIAAKRQLQRAWTTRYDPILKTTVKQFKQVPVLIIYEFEGRKFEKIPDKQDYELVSRIEETSISYWYPSERMPVGEESRRNDDIGLTHVHHFFTKRNLAALSCAWSRAQTLRSRFMLTSLMYKSSLLCAPLMSNFFAAMKGEARGGWVGKERSGTLYCPSIHSEVSVASQITSRKNAVRVTAASHTLPLINTSSATELLLPSNCIDYIFTDPPFGANKMYSELNFLWESWLRVRTDNTKEAISNKAQKKGIFEYESLMKTAFAQYYRVLKPGRWLTVEFSNTSNAVWNALQNALGASGFIVADVRSLDKKQGSILGYTTATAARQDLAISAYKPNGGLESRFQLEAGTPEGVWDFIRTHLRQLPLFTLTDGALEVLIERHGFRLFDQMVAFHVQRNVAVPMSATEFHSGLSQRFAERDGMYFLSEQVALYDKERMSIGKILQLQLFVTDESSAIQWLKQQLSQKSLTFQEIHPLFVKELSGWHKHEKPLELADLLEQNFLRYDGKDEVPSQIHSYLSTNFKELRNLPKDAAELRAKGKDRWYVPDPNKAGDLEKLRERALMKEFWEYLPAGYQPAKPDSQEGFIPGLEAKPAPIPRSKKMKIIRLEAVRAGFKNCWQNRDYRTIIAVAQRIPENVLQEDPKLLMWYDQAVTRTGDSS